MYAPEKALLVQWLGQLFTSGGDSGSIYYAKLGSFTYAIAIHRAQVTLTSSNYLVPGGAGLNQVVSYSGPLRAVIEKFKEHSDVDDVAWFKLKEHLPRLSGQFQVADESRSGWGLNHCRQAYRSNSLSEEIDCCCKYFLM
jgi:hypothetical protein